jgi:hypothetical protein
VKRVWKVNNFSCKIVFIEGIWDTDEAQREHALQVAKKDGIDYLIIQDADEFYMPDQFLLNLKTIEQYPNYPAYTCPWVKFWKSTDYVMEARVHDGKQNQVISLCPNFAVNVNWPGIHFNLSRLVNEIDKAYKLPGLCLHLCWVLSDDQVLKKISTWGHSHQFDYKIWYKHKWLAWTPKTKYIGVFSRANYNRAVKNSFELPKELIGFSMLNQDFVSLNLFDTFYSFCLDILSVLKIELTILFLKK